MRIGNRKRGVVVKITTEKQKLEKTLKVHPELTPKVANKSIEYREKASETFLETSKQLIIGFLYDYLR